MRDPGKKSLMLGPMFGEDQEMLIFGSCKTNTGIQREACFMSAFLKAVPVLVLCTDDLLRWMTRFYPASKGVSACKPSMSGYIYVTLYVLTVDIARALDPFLQASAVTCCRCC